MKVFLTHGYFLHEDEKEQQIMRPYPPLGLLYISAYLKQAGVNACIFDSTFTNRSDLKKELYNFQPDILALYTNLMTKVTILELIKEVKITYPDIKIILGGPDVTYNVEDYLQHGADVLVIGEGEQTMLELTEAVDKGLDLNEVDGLAFLQGGDVIKTKTRQKLKELNELPLPDRDAIDISNYLEVWKKHHGQSALNVSTQRGCPYTCKWCSTAVYGQSYRRRSPQKVVDEIVIIQNSYNPDTIWFVDDVFTVSHKWLGEFVEELELREIKLKFECISRADRMNEDVISLLKRAGCFRVWIGAESGSQRIIEAMDRRVSVNQVRQMIQETRKAGIEAGTFIMLGYPGETEEDIKETVRHLKESNPDHFTITKAYPIKGTALYEEISSIQTSEPDWATSTDRDRDFKRMYSSKYYDYALKWVVNEVNYEKQRGYFNKRKIKLKVKSLAGLLGMRIYKG
ncbi:MAG: B12-binding domain-containing radical SAM protein [Rickettsiales bacterium]|nr:B12-binding domain-containing radical SAM protein [Rickettsiales bacterium]